MTQKLGRGLFRGGGYGPSMAAPLQRCRDGELRAHSASVPGLEAFAVHTGWRVKGTQDSP